MTEYSVYILENPDLRKYIGITEDVSVRLTQHNSGISTWTRNRGPWRLIWQKGALTLSEARKLETLLKRQKGGEGLYRITGLSCSS